MPIALIHGLSIHNHAMPIFSQGVNTENSFYTDGPSITAAYGFINMLSDLEGFCPPLKKVGRVRKGITIKGFSFFIHHYQRDIGKVAFNSGTANYVATEDKLINPPIPLETYTADMNFSLIIDYTGSLPGDLNNLLNARTRRFNGGTILNEIMISDLNEDELVKYFKSNAASQIIDRSDLAITDWNEMMKYLAFYQNPETKKRDLRLHSGVFYAHQTGYQLLEAPCQREGALFNGNEECEHAYCEPIINLAEIQHTTHLKSFSDLHFWHKEENIEARTITLTTFKHKE